MNNTEQALRCASAFLDAFDAAQEDGGHLLWKTATDAADKLRTALASSQGEGEDSRKAAVWSDFEDQHLTDGNDGWVAAPIRRACKEAFDSEWPHVPAAEAAALAILRKAFPQADAPGMEEVPPHWTAGDKWARHPQTAQEWDWRDDAPNGPDRSVKRLNFAADLADPRAPDQMALVLRVDVMRVLGKLVQLSAQVEAYKRKSQPIPKTEGPSPKAEDMRGGEMPEIPPGMKRWHGGDSAPADIGEAADVLHADGTFGLANKRSILWGRPKTRIVTDRMINEYGGPPVETKWIIAYTPRPTPPQPAPDANSNLQKMQIAPDAQEAGRAREVLAAEYEAVGSSSFLEWAELVRSGYLNPRGLHATAIRAMLAFRAEARVSRADLRAAIDDNLYGCVEGLGSEAYAYIEGKEELADAILALICGEGE